MGPDEGLTEDVIVSIIQHIIMKTGIVNYTKVKDMLENQNLTFSDSYKNPGILKSVLRDAFGQEYLGIVEKIKDELMSFGHLDQYVENFLKRIG